MAFFSHHISVSFSAVRSAFYVLCLCCSARVRVGTSSSDRRSIVPAGSAFFVSPRPFASPCSGHVDWFLRLRRCRCPGHRRVPSCRRLRRGGRPLGLLGGAGPSLALCLLWTTPTWAFRLRPTSSSPTSWHPTSPSRQQPGRYAAAPAYTASLGLATLAPLPRRRLRHPLRHPFPPEAETTRLGTMAAPATAVSPTLEGVHAETVSRLGRPRAPFAPRPATAGHGLHWAVLRQVFWPLS